MRYRWLRAIPLVLLLASGRAAGPGGGSRPAEPERKHKHKGVTVYISKVELEPDKIHRIKAPNSAQIILQIAHGTLGPTIKNPEVEVSAFTRNSVPNGNNVSYSAPQRVSLAGPSPALAYLTVFGSEKTVTGFVVVQGWITRGTKGLNIKEPDPDLGHATLKTEGE